MTERHLTLKEQKILDSALRKSLKLFAQVDKGMTFKQIVDAFADFYTEDEVRIWFFSKQELLGGKRPANLSDEELERFVEQITTGAYL